METIKEEKDIGVKAEATKRDSPCSLWEGKVKLEKENREILVSVQIFHKDDAKNGQKLLTGQLVLVSLAPSNTRWLFLVANQGLN